MVGLAASAAFLLIRSRGIYWRYSGVHHRWVGMGYRSEWLLQVKGPAEGVARLTAEIAARAEKVSSGPHDEDESEYASTLQACRAEDRVLPDGQVEAVWLEDWTKCYSGWDRLIHSILGMARNEFGLKAAYGRLGEDPADVEFDNDEGYYVEYVRRLCLPGEGGQSK